MTAVETVNEFIRLIDAKDIEGAVALCAEDVEYDNVPMGKNMGRAAVLEFLMPMVAGVDEVQFIVHRQTATGNVVMNERTDRFSKGGVSADIPVAGVFEVNDEGEITLWRDYFDMGSVAAIMELLGAG
ncbi:MAG: limonene-1,2-epoxide hydrolase family protein [Actinomycetota bacterium]